MHLMLQVYQSVMKVVNKSRLCCGNACPMLGSSGINSAEVNDTTPRSRSMANNSSSTRRRLSWRGASDTTARYYCRRLSALRPARLAAGAVSHPFPQATSQPLGW